MVMLVYLPNSTTQNAIQQTDFEHCDVRSPVSCCGGGGGGVGSGENTRESLPLSQLFMEEKVRKNVGKCGGGWSAVKAITEAQPQESEQLKKSCS